MFNHLRDLLSEIDLRNQSEEVVPFEDDFVQQIQSLSSWDKIFVEKHLYKIDWQVGSPHLFSLLQREGFFNICLYLLKLPCADDVDNAFNDLLEVEHSLLAEVILNTAIEERPQSEKLIRLLQKCCESALQALLDDNSLMIPNYLKALEGHLMKEEDLQRFRNLHLKILTSMHCTRLQDALKDQKVWTSQEIFAKNASLQALTMEIIKVKNISLDILLESLTKTNFEGWKYALAILNMIISSSTEEIYLGAKKFIEPLFWRSCISRNEHQFQIFIIFMREIAYARGKDKKSTFLTWYRVTISEMNYKIQAEDFRIVMDFLVNVTYWETDIDFLDVYMKSSISAPVRMNELVQEFKQIAKIRLNALVIPEKAEKSSFPMETENIMDHDEEDDCVIYIE
ncbi:hypothetical protein DMENIID0001_099800 [Sergentomyia squamirostris]